MDYTYIDILLKALKLLKYADYAVSHGYSCFTLVLIIALILTTSLLPTVKRPRRCLDDDECQDSISVPLHLRTEKEIWTWQADSQLQHKLQHHVGGHRKKRQKT